jgi:DNA-binding CsgD family transcriptional regulator
LAPQGILHHLCAVLRNDDGGNLRVGVFRSTAAGPGDAGDIRLLVHLAPHLTRAVDLAGKFEALALAQRGVLDAVGASGRAVVVLDTEGRVLLASPPAEAILAAGDGLDAPGGRPAAWLARQSARLDRLIAAATAGRSSGVVVVARRSGQVPYVVTVAPLRRPQHWPLQSMPSAVLLVGDLGRLAGDAAAPLVRLYGLSPMQARVAVAIAGGDGLARVASSLGVSLNTARSHLQQALRKTGMRNQVALAALVTRAADLPDPALSS